MSIPLQSIYVNHLRRIYYYSNYLYYMQLFQLIVLIAVIAYIMCLTYINFVTAGDGHIPRGVETCWQTIPIDRSGRAVRDSDMMLLGSAHLVPLEVG